MFEVISHPFAEVTEGLSGIVVERALEVVTPTKSKGFSFWHFLLGILIIVFGVGLYLVFYYFPKKKKEEERLLKESKKIKDESLLKPYYN
ncbi:hypothetical protein [Arcicella rigui]|uniref:Uncharacterized protein n=1 Tax=Arcicella rigui TaxID=797020 RepID=A0ABU5QBL2_9BACT|nr:hypothetical protein [Arcicella rigui]MEA5139962.1 hypothetical protein [Arcicella rigui]